METIFFFRRGENTLKIEKKLDKIFQISQVIVKKEKREYLQSTFFLSIIERKIFISLFLFSWPKTNTSSKYSTK